MRAPCPCRDASLIVWGLARVITTCLLPHLLHPQVHDRSAEFWNFAFVSSIVIEYKDTRNLLPAPFNAFGVLALIPRTLYRCLFTRASGLRRLSSSGTPLEARSAARWVISPSLPHLAPHLPPPRLP